MSSGGGGFFDSLGQAFVAGGFEKLTKQKLWILREAARAGARPLAIWDTGQYEHRSTSARWQALTVGAMAATSAQTFVFETNGVRHLFYQPYASSNPLPGTHHFWLQGALRCPVLFDASMNSFVAGAGGQDFTLAQWLNAAPIGHMLRSIDWTYRIETSTRVNEPIVVQLRAMGGGLGHLAIRANGEAQFEGHDVGFMLAAQVAHQFGGGIEASVADAQPFLAHEPAGTSDFAAVMDGSVDMPSTEHVYDASSVLVPFVESLRASKTSLTLPPLSAKREKGAREGIIPAWLHPQPILALDDRTVFGGGSKGVAILPTHLCYASDCGQFVVPYSDITGAQFMVGTLAIRTRVLGDLVFSLYDAEKFAGALQHLVATSATTSTPPSAPPVP